MSNKATNSASFDPRAVDTKHLHQMFERLHDPVVARLVISFLDADLNLRNAFPGVYLRAHETVKRSRIRYAKSRQLGQTTMSVGRGCCNLMIHCAKAVKAVALWGAAKAIEARRKRAVARDRASSASNVILLAPPTGRASGVRHERHELHSRQA